MPGNPIVIYDGPSVIRQQGQMTGGGDSVAGVTVSGTPTAGQVITATSATAANWQTGGGGGGSVNSVTATDGSIVVAGTATDPTIATGTLDAIATAHAPAANWSNNSKKITSLANGSAAQDAAAFGQIPTALPPNGAAGGDLAGTYPNPTVKAITETSGPTDLVIGTITDGQVLKRVGGTLVSVAPNAGTVTNVSSANTSIAVANPTTTPALTVATLDVLATNGAPAANWSNNSKKITSLAVATASTDAASLANTLDQFGAPAANVALNAKKITGLANGVDKADAMAFGQLYTNALLPTGALAETYPRWFAGTAVVATLTTQTVKMVAIALPSGLTVTSITFVSGGTGLTGGNHQIFGLYDSTRALLRGTSDDTSTAWAASTAKTLNLTSTYTTVAAGLFYLAILVDATTPPNLVATQGGSTILGLAPILFGNSTTGQTSLPNPAAAITSAGTPCWAYIS